MKKDNLVYLKHILDSVNIILEDTKGLTFDSFMDSRLIVDSSIRHFQIIGEASKKISSEFKNQYPDFPFKKMAGMRDKLVHEYFDVKFDILWNTISSQLPKLKQELIKILNQ